MGCSAEFVYILYI